MAKKLRKSERVIESALVEARDREKAAANDASIPDAVKKSSQKKLSILREELKRLRSI